MQLPRGLDTPARVAYSPASHQVIGAASTTGGCGLGAPSARASYVSWPAGPRGRRLSTAGTGTGNHGPTPAAGSNEWIVRELNQFLRGWGRYFRYGNSARIFDAISQYAPERLAGFVGNATYAAAAGACGW